MMKTKKLMYGTLLTGAVTLLLWSATALAAVVYGETCDIGVYPYNPQAAENPGTYQPNKIVSGCAQRLPYPTSASTGQPYTPDPPNAAQNPVKSGDENKKVSWVVHQHAYFNDKSPLGGNYYYKAAVDKFEITLQPNLSKLDLGNSLQNLYCHTPKPSGSNIDTTSLNDCSGTVAGLYGGTTVSKQTVGNKVVVTWEFGVNDNSKKMIVWGADGTLTLTDSNGTPVSVNLGDPYNPYRHAEFWVNYSTKNNPEDIWVTTTTSRVLIADLAINKNNWNANKSKGCVNNNVNDAASGWCYLNPNNYNNYTKVTISKGGTPRTYFWFPIGSVASIWKKPEAPPPAVCTGLNLQPSSLNPNATTNMIATVTYSDGQSYNTEVTWQAGNGTVQPTTDLHQSSAPFNSLFTIGNPAQPASVTARVTNVQGGAQNSSICQQGVTVETPPVTPVCTGIALQPPFLNPSGTTNLSATVTFSNGQSYNTTVGWQATNGTMQPPSDAHASSAPFNSLFTIGNPQQPASATARVLSVVGADNSPICQQGVTVETPPEEGMCVDLSVSGYTAPVKAGDTILVIPSVVYSGNVQPDKIQWQESGDGYFFTTSSLQLIQPACPAIPTNNFPAPFTCRYFYTAANQGDSFTLTADPNPTNNPACVHTEPVIEPPDEKEPCDYLDFEFPDNNICINVDPDYNGQYQWTIGNNSFIENTAECKLFDENESYKVVAIDAENPALCSDEVTPEENDCTYFDFSFPGDQICVDTDYTGPVEWNIGGNTTTVNDDDCFQYNPDNSYEADATLTDNPVCRDQLAPKPPERPELIKKAKKTELSAYTTDVLTLRPTDSKAFYQLTYTPINGQQTTAVITDDISKGYIDAILLPEGSGATPGRITYDAGSMKVFEAGVGFLSQCPGEETDTNCYKGDIGSGALQLVKINSEVLITYTGTVDSALTDTICRDGRICQEKYLNSARANSVHHVSDEEVPLPVVESNRITIQIFCQYILTRAAGDIFLENDLSTGIDINICSRFRSATGIIVTPGEEETPPLVSTGPGEATIFTVGHEVCTAGQAGTVSNELAELYGQTVSGLSSQICEVKLRTGSPWKQEVITNSIDENRTRVSRWGAQFGGLGAVVDLSQLLFQYTDLEVYHIEGDARSGNIPLDEIGAKTFIIEDGDLYIDGDITYTGTCPKGPGQCNVRDVASLAFIVLNGSVYVDPSVTEISGVFFVQEGDASGSGRLYSGSPGSPNQQSNEQLVIFGSIYGDIDPLFAHRFFSGDPASDLGGIVIRFDQRVILNTPPGLRDVLNIQQTEVAR